MLGIHIMQIITLNILKQMWHWAFCYYWKAVASNVITSLWMYECQFNISNIVEQKNLFHYTKKKGFRADSWHTAFHKFCILRDNLYLSISFQLKCFSIFISNTWKGERVPCFRYFSLRCCWSLFVTDVGNLRHLTS